MGHNDLFFKDKVSAQYNWVLNVGLEKAIIIDKICDLIDLECNKQDLDRELWIHNKGTYDAIINKPMFFDVIPLDKSDILLHLGELVDMNVLQIEESPINKETFYVRITEKFIEMDDYEDYKHIWRAINE